MFGCVSWSGDGFEGGVWVAWKKRGGPAAKHRPRVDLRSGLFSQAEESTPIDAAATKQLRRTAARAAHAENTVLIGAALAALAGANAFAAFTSGGPASGSGAWVTFQIWVQI